MLEVAEELKNFYKKTSVNKNVQLNFKDLEFAIGNENLKTESMTIIESICSDAELVFGGCEAAEFSITVADITQDLTGQSFTVIQTLENNPNYVMPLGTYTVKSCKRQSDRRFKDIIAYDDMIKLDRDVTTWYNSRPFPVTLKSLRESLLVYCGIAYEAQDLTNDGVLINKTIRPSSMNGRDVMKRICELNGGFGHITRQNKFKAITLAGLGLYPSETLYPSEDLFPAESGEIIDGSGSGANYYPESTYEDYICRSIDQLRIRTNEEDGGVVVNSGTTGTNEYIIQGNFLISDKSKAELTDIAEALFFIIKNKYYRPHNMIVTGLPYLEVGDSILISTMNDVIESFIFSRSLTGIQVLKDTLGATGYEYRQNKVGLDVQISQLEQAASDLKDSTDDLQDTTEEIGQEIEEIQEFNGQTTVNLQRLEDGINAEVSRATSEEEKLSSRLTITESDISAEVSRASTAEGELSGRIGITESQVLLKVSKGEVSSQISVESGQVYIGGNRLIVNSTNFKLDANGNAEFTGTVNGAIVIAKEALYLCDQYHQANKEALGANDNALYIGSGFVDGAWFLHGLGVSGNLEVSEKVICNNLDVEYKINAQVITCTLINADSHTHNYYTSDIYWEDNGNSNCCFKGSSLRGASTAWVLANFEHASCDERMKEDICDLDEKVILAYMDFLPVQYRYKEKTNYNKKINFGVTAQNIMKIFEEHGLDWKLYDIIEEKSVFDKDLCGNIEEYTNGEDYYVVNDKNLHALHISMIQNQQKEINSLKKEISELKQLLAMKGVI